MRKRLGRSLRSLGLVAALPLLLSVLLPGAAPAAPRADTSTDVGLATGFQDTYLGHFQRGRALVGADFDLDERIDFYVGNPGDESYVLRNVPDGDGAYHFEIVQVLESGELAWSGVTADYDNDGDYDMFIGNGGNEGIGFDRLFRNNWMESGQTGLSFTDVSGQAGIRGPIPPGESNPIPVATAGVVAADYDNNGWIDFLASVSSNTFSLPQIEGREVLWHNNGPDQDGVVTFSDVTDAVGLGTTLEKTQHSQWLDFDNDGDMDIYENGWRDPSYLWRNELVETGVATFTDVTAAESPAGENLACPYEAFASAVNDFNNDGWQDIIKFDRLRSGEPPECPYGGSGHGLFINQGVDGGGNHLGFVNVGQQSGLLTAFPPRKGVMGCQTGDLNGDGAIDVYVGNGAPMDSSTPLGGQWDNLFLGTQPPNAIPQFAHRPELVNYAPPRDESLRYPPFPMRTHGTVIADVDGDGTQEMAVTEGGPAASPAYVREPDRLFKFTWEKAANWFIVRPVGNGVTSSRDAIGARLEITVRNDAGDTWILHRTLFGGSCFSAQNGYEIYFGLGDATTIESLEITWTDGTVETLTEGLSLNSRILVHQSETREGVPMRAQPDPSGTAAQLTAFLASHPRIMRPAAPPPPNGGFALECNE